MNNQTPNMATEPALTIGKLIADKAMLKTFISAIVALVATGFRFTADDAMVDNIATVVQLVALIVTPFIAQHENRQRATEQAKATRSAVFAPATTEALVKQAAATGVPDVPPPAKV